MQQGASTSIRRSSSGCDKVADVELLLLPQRALPAVRCIKVPRAVGAAAWIHDLIAVCGGRASTGRKRAAVSDTIGGAKQCGSWCSTAGGSSRGAAACGSSAAACGPCMPTALCRTWVVAASYVLRDVHHFIRVDVPAVAGRVVRRHLCCRKATLDAAGRERGVERAVIRQAGGRWGSCQTQLSAARRHRQQQQFRSNTHATGSGEGLGKGDGLGLDDAAGAATAALLPACDGEGDRVAGLPAGEGEADATAEAGVPAAAVVPPPLPLLPPTTTPTVTPTTTATKIAVGMAQ